MIGRKEFSAMRPDLVQVTNEVLQDFDGEKVREAVGYARARGPVFLEKETMIERRDCSLCAVIVIPWPSDPGGVRCFMWKEQTPSFCVPDKTTISMTISGGGGVVGSVIGKAPSPPRSARDAFFASPELVPVTDPAAALDQFRSAVAKSAVKACRSLPSNGWGTYLRLSAKGTSHYGTVKESTEDICRARRDQSARTLLLVPTVGEGIEYYWWEKAPAAPVAEKIDGSLTKPVPSLKQPAELWWQTKDREAREQWDAVVTLRREIRKITGMGGE